MAVILDTNALSAFLKNEPGVGAVVAQAHSLFVPVIVTGEYRYGLQRSARRATLTAKLEAFLADVRILVIDEATSRVYAVVRDELRAAGTPIPENDVWIASLARQNALPLLSDDSHFDHVAGVDRRSWSPSP